MTLHLVRISGITALIVLCIIYPFLPGEYDSLAMTLSAMAQTVGALGLLLVVPVGVLWLAYELRKQARRKRNLGGKTRGYYFALASVIASSMVALVFSLIALATVGYSLWLLVLALSLYVVLRLRPKLKSLKNTESENFNPLPLYLLLIPVAVLLFQLVVAAPATEFSRNRAIAKSAELINDIESYYARHRRYPISLLALHKDYRPSVVGIEKFHYAPHGEAYNLFFERPTFLFDFGIREIVMYNKLDEHIMVSHTAWILAGAPETMAARQGWHSSHNASTPHWKYFWFD